MDWHFQMNPSRNKTRVFFFRTVQQDWLKSFSYQLLQLMFNTGSLVVCVYYAMEHFVCIDAGCAWFSIDIGQKEIPLTGIGSYLYGWNRWTMIYPRANGPNLTEQQKQSVISRRLYFIDFIQCVSYVEICIFTCIHFGKNEWNIVQKSNLTFFYSFHRCRTQLVQSWMKEFANLLIAMARWYIKIT